MRRCMPVLVLMEDLNLLWKPIIIGCSLTFILVGILVIYKTGNQCYCNIVNNQGRGAC